MLWEYNISGLWKDSDSNLIDDMSACLVLEGPLLPVTIDSILYSQFI